ncbi:MAG: phosphopentomutase [candidate division WOR-3 bacterium]|jgi:phosphopentomutase|nr:phosphopentomutase [candidate division WOR-3 bacterium]MCR4423752.1 phosphopentomutase [candidate division WOR-3 bacterium]MDH7519091.1 phosphopentomutase [bacterium]
MAKPHPRRRALLIVLDGVGCGALPDADRFGDQGSNTLKNLACKLGGLALPNLSRLGLGNIVDLPGVPPEKKPQAAYGRMAEMSAGKDSTTGHWEIAGVITTEPFPLFPHGFPEELLHQFERRIGRRVIGNIAASGTEIINRLGAEHLKTGFPIVYTSADSVFQIACHIDVVPLAELYRFCTIARELLTGRYRVARVIARPFAGKPGAFYRTPERKDFSCPPPQPTLLDNVKEAGLASIGIGKVDDLFAHQGLTEIYHSVNNQECIDYTLNALQGSKPGLIFVNLVQFDMDWGHRNDSAGFARGLAEFDLRLPEIIAALEHDDIMFLTADHGCDPTTPSTDHSREYVPLLVYGAPVCAGINIGTRATFADLGKTIAEYLGVKPTPAGTSFLNEIVKPEFKNG